MNTRADKYDMDIRHPQRQRELKVQDMRAVQLLDGFGGLPLDIDDVPPNLKVARPVHAGSTCRCSIRRGTSGSMTQVETPPFALLTVMPVPTWHKLSL